MAKAFALKEIRVTSRTPASRESYAKEIGEEYGLNVRAVESTEAALNGADLVVSATTTSTPFVKDSWLAKGITVYSIGKNQEMESEVYKNADKFVVDSWLHCKNKSDMQRMIKENYLSEKDLYAELPELLSGKKPARESDESASSSEPSVSSIKTSPWRTRFTKARWRRTSGRGCRTDS